MHRFTTLSILGVALAGVFLLGACSTVSTGNGPTDAQVLLTAQATAAVPTELANQGLKVAGTQACQVDSFASVQIDDVSEDQVNWSNPQGDMIAWSPAGNLLAYVTPPNGRWAWFVGDLVIYNMAMQKNVFTSQNLQVFGDLTWAPDGKHLAYIVLDSKSKTYTIEVLDLQTGASQDLFSTVSPQTDSWSSPKGIDHWSNANTLLVTSSCDVDCSRQYSYNLQTGQLTVQGEMRKNQDKTLVLTNQYVSPDAHWQVAVDLKDNTWISNKTKGQVSMLLATTPVNEVKWSGDSSYLALRTDDAVDIFQTVCSQK